MLKNVRSTGFYKSLIAGIFYGLLGLYFVALFLFLGFNLDKILFETGSKYNPLQQFNGALLYTLLTGLSFRFVMQSLTTFDLPPYQVLNIKRNTLVNFVILKPLFNPMNYWTLLIVVPFAIKYVALYYGVLEAISFVWMYVAAIWFNSLLASFLKRKYGPSFANTLVLLAIFLALVALEYFKVFSLFSLSLSATSFVVLNPLGCLIALATAVFAYGLNKWFFSRNYYAETFNKHANRQKTIMTDFSFLNRFGMAGELMAMEIKLILRHKRTKSVLFMSGFFLFYGLIFYPQKIYADSNGMLFFVAIFITGLMMLMFGQWLISWDSSHFDGLMTKNIPAQTYIKANYYLMAAFGVVSFLLTTPYFFFGQKIIFMHISAFLYNMGVNVFVLLFFSTYNTKRIDLSKSSAMNYQGVSVKNFLVMLPMLAFPVTAMWLLTTFFSWELALSVFSVIGIIGIIFSPKIIQASVKQFQARKYMLAQGFRESE
jgi:hypothetical protein